jgi:hypothetical protein
VYRQIHKRSLAGELRVNVMGKRVLKHTVLDPHTNLDRLIGLRDVEVSRISRQSAHEGCKFVSPTHRPSLPPRRHPWHSFVLEADSMPGP